ncbi:uncharacterized protein BP5553_07010 [Venustampulla echinocandica]|uniref:Uncharacterized protein n=1 Tax=Venustampulla echinocandica TaxID=2656787 RepID=A0A370TI97_9HELO|nr:uncharacterized protein BP5553_07010 [Venustampulla echinocandica]RDL35079.1 hypothetical protein BP5553_07010 [Venustampulla echinocandica]
MPPKTATLIRRPEQKIRHKRHSGGVELLWYSRRSITSSAQEAPIPTGNRRAEGNQAVSKLDGITNVKAAILAPRSRDCNNFAASGTRHAMAVPSDNGAARSGGSVSSPPFRRYKSVCDTCEASHDYAKRYTASEED